MNTLAILGAGTAGSTLANRLRTKLQRDKWRIVVVDKSTHHFYQPGFLFIPFGIYDPADVVKPVEYPIPAGVELLRAEIEAIDPDSCSIAFTSGESLKYDVLVIATGCTPRPEETDGLADYGWNESAFEFYTYAGATRLAKFFENWQGGKLVIDIVEMPIKCPVAPIEFAFLADWWFTQRGMRNKVEIELVTPLSGAFTRPICSEVLGYMFDRKNIKLTPDYSLARVDGESRKIYDWEDREIAYDCLVTVPVNMGDDAIGRSGLGDDLNFVPTDKQNLRSKKHENIFVIGDATDVPTSKAGSVAHFEAEILTENIVRHIEGKELLSVFDGHTNCFIESGFGKAVLVDFNYDIEPLPGKFPLPVLGPMTLLKESRVNHWGKMAFRWIYWNLLVKGKELYIPPIMSMAGKYYPKNCKETSKQEN